MDKSIEIAQVNELKFYLNWDYVKDICNEAVRKENEKLEKQLKVAKDILKEYADEPECYGSARQALEQIEELDK